VNETPMEGGHRQQTAQLDASAWTRRQDVSSRRKLGGVPASFFFFRFTGGLDSANRRKVTVPFPGDSGRTADE
jgi:hypothetical protein